MANASSSERRVERERVRFRQLLAQNPNHFGTSATAGLKAVKAMASNSSYEQLTCLGYNPDLDQLEATVQVKLPFGYGGNLCMAGTTEYVRFFVDYGAGWQDAGAAAFKIHDLPDGNDCSGQPDKPLAYSVGVALDPQRDCCDAPLLPLVRAVLSWELMPPAGNAAWSPIWGNVFDGSVQIKPSNKLWCLLKHVDVSVFEKLKLELAPIEGIVAPIPLPDPPPEALAALARLYEPQAGASRDKASKASGPTELAVEPHRFGFADLQTTISSGSFSQPLLEAKITEWAKLGLDWSASVGALEKTTGDVGYEELRCLALDPNREWLAASFTIKRPNGYSGDLCTAGSVEYVSFWADWDDRCEWTYLDTVAVPIHDISTLPAGGLDYVALLKVNVNAHRLPCEKPRIARVRAVLSWNAPPSTVDAAAVPYWGNRLDAHVQIRPGIPVSKPAAILWTLGGIFVDQIEQGGVIGTTKGLTTPPATFALSGLAPDSLGRPCPFGGRVAVTGPAFPGYYYRVRVREAFTGTPVSVVTKLKNLKDMSFTSFDASPLNADGFFAYVENIEDVLGRWDTPSANIGLWEVTLEIATAPNEPSVFGAVTYFIQLDNVWPVVDINIDSGGNCKDFPAGTTVTGHFVATDAYFGSFGLGTLPFAAPLGQLTPPTGSTPTAAAPGNPWQLVTTHMQPCGYVVVVTATDRAILDSGSVGHQISKSVGLCLRA